MFCRVDLKKSCPSGDEEGGVSLRFTLEFKGHDDDFDIGWVFPDSIITMVLQNQVAGAVKGRSYLLGAHSIFQGKLFRGAT